MKNNTTKTMTTRETLAWLNNYFFGNTEMWECIYTDALTAIYLWNLDNDVEVIRTIEVDAVLITVNFYEGPCSGIPSRSGTVTFDNI